MPDLSDPDLLHRQYHDAHHLNARIALHTRFSTNRYGWYVWVFDHLRDLPAEARVLEVGCGPGGLWQANAHRLPTGWHIALTDRSPGMVRQARAAVRGLSATFTFASADAQALPFPNRTFDAVLANHMLYHVPDRPRALAEIHRVLRPGGQLLAATVGQDHLHELAELVQSFDPQRDALTTLHTTGFTLENGEPQLRAHFSQVRLRRYEDALLVTEVEPLATYLRSSVRFPIPEAQMDDLRAFLAREIARHGGAIHITKSLGMFIASV